MKAKEATKASPRSRLALYSLPVLRYQESSADFFGIRYGFGCCAYNFILRWNFLLTSDNNDNMTSVLIDSMMPNTRYLYAPLSIPSGVPDFTASKRRSGSPTFEPQRPFECGAATATATATTPSSSSSSDNADDADFLIDEDETSFCLTIEMPGVRGKDISVEVDSGMLTVSGYRRLGGGNKKQRLQKRFPVDTQVVDVTRSVATIWKDALVLYAPKQSKSTSTTCMTLEEPEFLEFCSPGAERLLAQETTVCE
jgi:HSP20 family molecular chaperone IbpA